MLFRSEPDGTSESDISKFSSFFTVFNIKFKIPINFIFQYDNPSAPFLLHHSVRIDRKELTSSFKSLNDLILSFVSFRFDSMK